MYISQNDIESIWLYKCHISIKFATILSCSQGRNMFYINWSSSSIGWLSLRNIHFTNGNESFPFVCPLSFYRTGLWETRWVSYKKHKLLSLYEYMH